MVIPIYSQQIVEILGRPKALVLVVVRLLATRRQRRKVDGHDSTKAVGRQKDKEERCCFTSGTATGRRHHFLARQFLLMPMGACMRHAKGRAPRPPPPSIRIAWHLSLAT